MDFELLNKKIEKNKDRFPIDSELINFATDKVCFLAINNGYSSTYSKKAKLFFKNKAFYCEWKEGILVYRLIDSFLKKDKINVELRTLGIHLLPITTNKGMIYSTTTKAGNICWTGHFFDRYAERINKPLDRKNAIKEFMKNQLLYGNLTDFDKFNEGIIKYYHKDGIGLGVTNGKIILYKTFVSNDMFNFGQKKTLEKLKENKPLHIDEEIFIKMLIEKDELSIVR